mmetsp:Transcript_115171/g.273778  ORF Transcript_115171/g.273778 Transcript_115171/m.273778 type:complete len:96 (+) Transcript_115171:75-362(+)
MRAMWSWLLCLAAVVALRPEHEIHVHGTGMEGHDAGHKKTADVDEGPPVPRCMLKDRAQVKVASHWTSCKDKTKSRCEERSKCKWCTSWCGSDPV